MRNIEALMATGTRVQVNPGHNPRSPDIFGEVVGFGFVGSLPHYIVELERGKFTEQRELYIRLVTCHPDSVINANYDTPCKLPIRNYIGEIGVVNWQFTFDTTDDESAIAWMKHQCEKAQAGMEENEIPILYLAEIDKAGNHRILINLFLDEDEEVDNGS